MVKFMELFICLHSHDFTCSLNKQYSLFGIFHSYSDWVFKVKVKYFNAAILEKVPLPVFIVSFSSTNYKT